MDFQVVVLAGGDSKSLSPLVSQEIPKPLLPVANRPVLSYVLELLEASNLKDLIVVVEGEDVALRVGGWISSAYVDRLHVEVAAVPEEAGTAGALRAVAHHLTAKDILVVSGDLVSDVPPGAVAATHRRLGAVVTALLCNTPVSGPSESGSSVGKDKGRKFPRVNIVGLDHTRQYLLHVAAGAEVGKDIKIHKSILQANGQLEIRADLMDAHMYAFQRTILQEVLDQKEMFHSIKHDVFPYLVRTQLWSEVLDKGVTKNGLNGAAYSLNSLDPAVEILTNRTHKCCAYIANKSKYCSRLNSVQAFCDINRDVIGEAGHLSGYSFSAQNNIVHASAELGSKTTLGKKWCDIMGVFETVVRPGQAEHANSLRLKAFKIFLSVSALFVFAVHNLLFATGSTPPHPAIFLRLGYNILCAAAPKRTLCCIYYWNLFQFLMNRHSILKFEASYTSYMACVIVVLLVSDNYEVEKIAKMVS